MALCQMYGAALKSIGHTLYEDMTIDEKGYIQNTRLGDYGVPMITEQPEDFKAVLIDVDDEVGPYGLNRSVRFRPTGGTSTIAIAIHDAVGFG